MEPRLCSSRMLPLVRRLLLGNNVVAICSQPVHTGGLRLMTSGREVQPALGLAWAHCVNHRVFLSREAHPFLAADPAESSHLQSQVQVKPQRRCWTVMR